MSRYSNFVLAKFTWPFRFINSIIPHRCLPGTVTIKKWRHLYCKFSIIFIIFMIIATSFFTRIRFSSITNNILTKFSLKQDDIVGCHFPKISLSTYDLKFALPKIIHPMCRSKLSPVSIDNYTVRLIYNNLTCTVIFYLGYGDQHYREISMDLLYNKSISLLSDHFIVRCNHTKTILPLINRASYLEVPYISIRYDRKIRQRLADVPKKKDDLNILILGLDSVSRLQYERMLPKTYAYITEKLKGIVLKGYNILGDGTPAQVIPMLTSMQERELPSTLHRDKNGSFVDVYPFIWNTYRDQGYVTGYAEDGPGMGIWTLRLKGFNQTPTDHYMTPFYRLPAANSYLYAQNSYCFGNQTSFELFLSYIRRFWTSYSTDKKFFFGFFKQYTHNDYSRGSLLDGSILNLLRTLNESRELERTIVILMSDHGARFSAARISPQGTIEERLPFMSFILPPSFHQKYPHAVNALRTNINRFTTPFDVHATLLSLLNMKKVDSLENVNVAQRNISLFNIIPIQRTCDHIRLPPHWCSCLQWKKVRANDIIIKQAAKYIVNYINQLLSVVDGSLCHPLTLDSIRGAQMYKSNKIIPVPLERGVRVLGHWNKTNDIVFYQITFGTKPNKAIYEATVQYTSQNGGLKTDHTDISRLNAYKSSSACIVRSYPHLRKFCFCSAKL